MASINLYGEFTITVSVPVIGLLLIFMCYCGRLWWARRSMANATDAVEKDTEQGQASGSDEDEQYALTTSKMRDWAVWLAIGWLFLVYTILCRTTFRSFACQEIDAGESYHQVSRTTRLLVLSVHNSGFSVHVAGSSTRVDSDRLHGRLQLRLISGL